jgi:hypothetical protein
MIAKIGETEFERRHIQGLQTSHRCHHPECFNPTHLIMETPTENNKRKACKTLQMCFYKQLHPLFPCILPKTVEEQMEDLVNTYKPDLLDVPNH